MLYIDLKKEKEKIASVLRSIEVTQQRYFHPGEPGRKNIPRPQEKTLNALMGFMTVFNNLHTR